MEAAGGFGKSVFAAELVDGWGAVPIWVLLEEGGVPAQLLAGRLRTAVSRAGFALAAAEMGVAGDDPVGAIDALLGALARESCALVFDDAHHATRDAALLIDRLASQIEFPQRLVVLARHLPGGLERLRRAGPVQLSADELALRPDETLLLCRTGFGLDVSIEEAHALDIVTGGWTAAAVLAASRARRSAQSLRVMAGLGAGQANPLRAILAEVLAAPGLDPRLVARIGALPLLDRDLTTRLSGDGRFLEHALGAGLPLTETTDGWWELPGPVRDLLGAAGDLDRKTLMEAALHYEERGRLGTAIQMLLAAGAGDEAAELLGAADPARIEAIDALELMSAVERIPPAVLDRSPAALLAVARSLQTTDNLALRAAYVDRLATAVECDGSPELRRAADAERAFELVKDGNEAEAAARLALGVLDETPADEPWTQARALSALGRATIWLADDGGRVQIEDRHRASGYLEQAERLYVGLGHHEAAANMATYRALRIELALGRPEVALRILDDVVGWLLGRPRRLATLLSYRAEVLLELGRFEDAEADVREVLRICEEQLGDEAYYAAAYAEWVRLHSCSLRGDAAGAVAQAREVERRRGDWWGAAGPDFLAEAADCLDRVGETALAWEYMRRALEDPGDAIHLVAIAECALLARHGDPELAQVRLREVKRRRLDPRDYWRVTLFQAHVALRLGQDGAGALAATAFEEAAALGHPQLPLLRERELSEALLGLAMETGLPAARGLQAVTLPIGLSVLGRFELSVGGRSVRLVHGQGTQLLKLVAVSGGRVHAEQAMEALWPDVAPRVGRNRLRVVLSRLRALVPEVLVREGELLALGPDVRLDLAEFARGAAEARALVAANPLAAVAVARVAIARYRGPLLPHDPYEDWAEGPRETAAQSMLGLLDLCATVAADRGDLDETRRIVERTIELAPYDEDRYLRVATILHRQGRKGAALSVLRRARAALAQMGLDPPRALVELERGVAASDPTRPDLRGVMQV